MFRCVAKTARLRLRPLSCPQKEKEMRPRRPFGANTPAGRTLVGRCGCGRVEAPRSPRRPVPGAWHTPVDSAARAGSLSGWTVRGLMRLRRAGLPEAVPAGKPGGVCPPRPGAGTAVQRWPAAPRAGVCTHPPPRTPPTPPHNEPGRPLPSGSWPARALTEGPTSHGARGCAQQASSCCLQQQQRLCPRVWPTRQRCLWTRAPRRSAC